MSTKAKFWIAGLVVAAAGVILAKVISPIYISRPVGNSGFLWQV